MIGKRSFHGRLWRSRCARRSLALLLGAFACKQSKVTAPEEKLSTPRMEVFVHGSKVHLQSNPVGIGEDARRRGLVTIGQRCIVSNELVEGWLRVTCGRLDGWILSSLVSTEKPSCSGLRERRDKLMDGREIRALARSRRAPARLVNILKREVLLGCGADDALMEYLLNLELAKKKARASRPRTNFDVECNESSEAECIARGIARRYPFSTERLMLPDAKAGTFAAYAMMPGDACARYRKKCEDPASVCVGTVRGTLRRGSIEGRSWEWCTNDGATRLAAQQSEKYSLPAISEPDEARELSTSEIEDLEDSAESVVSSAEQISVLEATSEVDESEQPVVTSDGSDILSACAQGQKAACDKLHAVALVLPFFCFRANQDFIQCSLQSLAVRSKLWAVGNEPCALFELREHTALEQELVQSVFSQQANRSRALLSRLVELPLSCLKPSPSWGTGSAGGWSSSRQPFDSNSFVRDGILHDLAKSGIHRHNFYFE